MRRFVSSFSLALALFAVTPGDSRADSPPPEAEACHGKSVGDKCDGGTCQDSTCSRATPNGAVEYACVLCKASEAPASEPTAVKPASEKKNCSAAPDALLFGLAGLVGTTTFVRRRT